jgi:hypothetical protein
MRRAKRKTNHRRLHSNFVLLGSGAIRCNEDSGSLVLSSTCAGANKSEKAPEKMRANAEERAITDTWLAGFIFALEMDGSGDDIVWISDPIY